MLGFDRYKRCGDHMDAEEPHNAVQESSRNDRIKVLQTLRGNLCRIFIGQKSPNKRFFRFLNVYARPITVHFYISNTPRFKYCHAGQVQRGSTKVCNISETLLVEPTSN
jgi:hypothetical protein